MGIRPFRPSDFGSDGVSFNYAEGQNCVYPRALWESNVCFQRKMDIFPCGCLAYADENDKLIGYAFSHPWRTDRDIVPLDAMDLVIPKDPDCYYIHDVAVLERYRGKGIGKELVLRTLETGRGYGFKKFKLVSVLDSLDFWRKFGFMIFRPIEYAEEVYGYVMELEE